VILGRVKGTDDARRARNNQFQRLSLSLSRRYTSSAASIPETGAAIPPPAEKICPSYLLNKPLKDNHYYGEYNLTHKTYLYVQNIGISTINFTIDKVYPGRME
jgi:hypothetical protein